MQIAGSNCFAIDVLQVGKAASQGSSTADKAKGAMKNITGKDSMNVQLLFSHMQTYTGIHSCMYVSWQP